MSKQAKLQTLRAQIDALDEKLVALLNQRIALAMDIGQEKARTSTAVFAPARERDIYEHIRRCNTGMLPAPALEAIYREIMSAALNLQKPLRVSYLGPVATFTHEAGLKKFGRQVTYVPACTITDVFSEVQKGNCDYGVVPVENSIEGAVNHTLDMFVDSELKICSEILTTISHALMSSVALADIRRVYSKAEVFGQCRLWLESSLPNRELVETSSTARAAEIAAAEPGAAAIGNELAAQVYNLNVVAAAIEDSPKNVTRFLVIALNDAERTGRDKTSLVFSVKDRAGALHDMLMPFKEQRVNLTKIESRPSKKKAWEYYFFIDAQGHRQDRNLRRALAQLEPLCHYVKVLGSYPHGEL